MSCSTRACSTRACSTRACSTRACSTRACSIDSSFFVVTRLRRRSSRRRLASRHAKSKEGGDAAQEQRRIDLHDALESRATIARITSTARSICREVRNLPTRVAAETHNAASQWIGRPAFDIERRSIDDTAADRGAGRYLVRPWLPHAAAPRASLGSRRARAWARPRSGYPARSSRWSCRRRSRCSPRARARAGPPST